MEKTDLKIILVAVLAFITIVLINEYILEPFLGIDIFYDRGAKKPTNG